MLITFLLVVHAIIAALLVGVILMQKSEGGGLGMGSGPSGLMTARGAADFLTRATSVLATLFVLMAFLLAGIASFRGKPGAIDTSLAHQPAPTPITAPTAPVTPTGNIPMMGSPIPAAPTTPQPQQATPPAATTSAPAPKAESKAAKSPEHHAEAAKPAPARIRTIPVPTGNASVGINGVTTGRASSANQAAPRKAAPPVFSIAPKPGDAQSTAPTIDLPAPPVGNSAQPR